jgi:hypothetical protein
MASLARDTFIGKLLLRGVESSGSNDDDERRETREIVNSKRDKAKLRHGVGDENYRTH